jgi:hypothetical protein
MVRGNSWRRYFGTQRARMRKSIWKDEENLASMIKIALELSSFRNYCRSEN